MPKPCRLASILRSFGLIWFSICSLTQAVRRDGLAALGHPQQIQDTASAKLLSITSSGFIAYEDTTIVPSLVQATSGVVLELGPGLGNQIHRFDISRVNYIYSVKPNPQFKDTTDTLLDKHSS